MQRRSSSNEGSEQTHRRDIERAGKGARSQINEASKHNPEGVYKALVLKLGMLANKPTGQRKGMQRHWSLNYGNEQAK